MKKLRLFLFLLLSLLLLFGASLMAQEAEGNRLLFQVYESATDTRSLHVLDAATGETSFISELNGDYNDAGWSPDGRVWLVDAPEQGQWRLRFFDIATSEESSFEGDFYSTGCDAGVYFSPNGEQFAYLSREEESYFLNLQNLADGSSYQIPAEQYSQPYWSPDSEYFYLGMSFTSITSELYRASDGSIIADAQLFQAFSPDSTYVFYLEESGAVYLYKMATGESLKVADSGYGAWSPTGRYFVPTRFPSSESLRLYNTESQSFEPIDLGFPIALGGWTSDESGIFLAADIDETLYFPATLLYYDFASQSTTTILEDVDRVGYVVQNGDWFGISYNSNQPSDPRELSNAILFYDGTEALEPALPPDMSFAWLNLKRLGEGFMLYSDDGISYFDTSSRQHEMIYSSPGYSFPTVSANHLAFIGGDMEGNKLYVWDSESKATSMIDQEANFIFGWRNGGRNSLFYCGEG